MNRHLRLWKAVMLSVVVLACVATALAQQDLQVVVSGPWSFLVNPRSSKQLLLVAPGAPSQHRVYLVEGTDPRPFSKGKMLPAPSDDETHGSYTFTYKADKGTLTMINSVVLCGGNVANPDDVVSSRQNYVITLPMPDAYTNYHPEGLSESIVSNDPINPTPSPKPYDFTTVMVLHYGVKSIPDSVNVGTYALNTKASGNTGGHQHCPWGSEAVR